ncbi:MAG: chromosomal replication initiator protein DnaA [Omnitrophica bacterium]|nr:chromosomal replication initiator protein DnaA [Candidatus Omnitrophota bacterium]
MTNNHIELWDNLLGRLRVEVGEQIFNAWFSPISPISVSESTFTLGVPSEFFKEWIRDRYSEVLAKNLSKVAGKKLSIDFVIAPVEEPKPSQKRPDEKSTHREKKGWFRSVFPKQGGDFPPKETRLNPKYTFDDFVVGPNNRFAHAAAMAIAESPARAYNPLFIYGGVGLGKTHLMHAMGNELFRKSPKTTILYISSEEFTNQLIMAIQTRSTPKFRERYRTVDILLIDDIHFIAGKESTQEEFFHTFNSLYDAHKQIVLSSDRSPKEIRTLEERLISRFAWGLITDMQPPDFETRTAILRKKSEKATVRLPDELFTFLAGKIKTNIRELEGALIRVIAYAELMNKEITVGLAKEVLKGMIIEGERKIGVDIIQKKVAQYFNISPLDMKARKRTKTVAYPRQVAMYLSRDLTDLSLPEIGGSFGGRDHTTVMHACDKIEKGFKNDEKVRWIIDKLVLDIKG